MGIIGQKRARAAAAAAVIMASCIYAGSAHALSVTSGSAIALGQAVSFVDSPEHDISGISQLPNATTLDFSGAASILASTGSFTAVAAATISDVLMSIQTVVDNVADSSDPEYAATYTTPSLTLDPFITFTGGGGDTDILKFILNSDVITREVTPGLVEYTALFTGFFKLNEVVVSQIYGIGSFSASDSGLVGFQLNLTAIPLPAALPLFVTAMGGLGAVGAWRRRRAAKQAA